MHIGLLTPYYPDQETLNSGLATHFATLANALAADGHQVTVIHVRPVYVNEGSGVDEQKNGGATILIYKVALPSWLTGTLGSKWAVISFLQRVKCMLFVHNKLNRLIETYSIDVIETTSYYSLGYLYLKYKKPPIPIITRVSTTFSQIMDEHYPFKSRLFKLLGKMEIDMIKVTKHRLTHARNHAVELEMLYGILAFGFNIIPHGISMPALSENTKQANSPIKVLYVGRMEYRKGIDVLLAAIPIVLAQNNNVTFELTGADTDDTYQNGFRAMHSADVNSKVRFRGVLAMDEINAAYAACDIFVAPSRYESFGLIYIEAMSYGKPVIGCNVGGVPEIIEDNKNGLLANVGNAQSLAEKLLYLINNPEQRQQMAEAARQTVEEKFTAEKLAAKSVAYYQQVIAGVA